MGSVIEDVEGNVLVSSPGMHEMGDRIVPLLKARGARFSHLRAGHTIFANGEIKPEIPYTVRGMHAFLLHPFHPDPNGAIVSMLLTCDALRGASVADITLVLPYIPYLRQDRRDRNDAGRTPISARLLANLIESNDKIARVVTLDMHADQEEGFFDIPVDNLNGGVVHAEYFRTQFRGDFSNVVVVAPDVGSVVRCHRFARRLGENVQVLQIDKKRTGPNKVEVLSFTGDVTGRDAIVFDDMIDTGGTIRAAVAETLRRGARSACACVTHALFSGGAAESFLEARYPVVITPSIPRPFDYWRRHEAWLETVSIDELLAEAMHEASIVGGSLSKLSK